MNNYFISIVTVCLNSEKSILKTINSINSQIFKNFEYIIIDGKSSDRTLELIKKNIKIPYKIISEKDNGIYQAMNKGIELSKGKYFMTLNSDDWLYKNSLQNIYNFIKKNNYPDAIYGNALFYKNEKKYSHVKANIKKIKKKMSLLHPSTVIKCDIMKKEKFNENLKISSDYELILRLLKKNYKFLYLDKVITFISMGGASANLEQSSSEFYLIQKKYNNFLLSIINYLKFYHFYIFKIFFFKIIKFFKKNL